MLVWNLGAKSRALLYVVLRVLYLLKTLLSGVICIWWEVMFKAPSYAMNA